MTAPSYTSWHVGMKVVCVRGNKPRECLDGTMSPIEWLPVDGHVYTIADLIMEEILYLSLDELLPIDLFDARNFRPVQARKTDISVFEQLLVSTKLPVGEDA